MIIDQRPIEGRPHAAQFVQTSHNAGKHEYNLSKDKLLETSR